MQSTMKFNVTDWTFRLRSTVRLNWSLIC